MLRALATLASAFIYANPANAQTPTTSSVARALPTCSVTFNITEDDGKSSKSNEACKTVAVSNSGGLTVEFTMAPSSSFYRVSYILEKEAQSSNGPRVSQVTLRVRNGKVVTGKVIGYCDLAKFAPINTINVFRCMAMSSSAPNSMMIITATGVITGKVEPGFYAALLEKPKEGL